MFSLSDRDVFRRLEFDNPWWVDGLGIDKHYAEFKLRLYFQPLIQLIRDRSVNRAVVVMGPRRVGKTDMLFHAL